MDIRYAILGLLGEQPLSGYDLKKIIAESDLFYWSGNNNQIYHSLVALHQQGLVSQEIQVQSSLPARKVYTLTASGRDELLRWLSADPELPEFRDPFLIQLTWADDLPPNALDDLLARYAGEVEVLLRMRQASLERQESQAPRSPRERLLRMSIARHIVDRYQQELDWVNRLQSDLQVFDQPHPPQT